jgi:hypothetical protein
VLISHLADIEAKLASIPVQRPHTQLCVPSLTPPLSPPQPFGAAAAAHAASTTPLFPLFHAAPAQMKPDDAVTSPLTGLSQSLAATLQPLYPAAVAAEAEVARAQPAISGDGPVALALAAARESRHRRAAAVAAATATATAAAAAAAAAFRSTVAIKSEGSSTTVTHHAPQEHVTEAENCDNCAVAGGTFDQDPKSEIAQVVHASTSSGGDADYTAAAAAASDNAPKVASSEISINEPANDATRVITAEGAASAAADGIILWSRMERDKRVHLNDFLANR